MCPWLLGGTQHPQARTEGGEGGGTCRTPVVPRAPAAAVSRSGPRDSECGSRKRLASHGRDIAGSWCRRRDVAPFPISSAASARTRQEGVIPHGTSRRSLKWPSEQGFHTSVRGGQYTHSRPVDAWNPVWGEDGTVDAVPLCG